MSCLSYYNDNPKNGVISMIKTDGILLDIDGTMWDSTPLVSKAYKRAFRDQGIDEGRVSPDTLKGLFGRPMDEIFDKLLPDIPEEIRRAAQKEAIALEDDILGSDPCDIFFPGVLNTLKTLSLKKRLFIISNCQKGYIELVMEKGGFTDLITDHECFGNNGLSKAENIKLVVKRNNLNAPVYVGDTDGDRLACEEAKVPFIFASYGFGTPEHFDEKITSFPELASVIE
ncbi:MAG: HAD family hydrolase [Lachnospiraceae bacterium]|nr:HAD family hydrolase [Lachnospiraceae bacterium]